MTIAALWLCAITLAQASVDVAQVHEQCALNHMRQSHPVCRRYGYFYGPKFSCIASTNIISQASKTQNFSWQASGYATAAKRFAFHPNTWSGP